MCDVDIGQRWRERLTGGHFTVRRTYPGNPVNPAFLVEYEPPGPGLRGRGVSMATAAFIDRFCERVGTA